MEGMLMLSVMILITAVLTCTSDGGQRKRAASLCICAAMMCAYIPKIHTARAESSAAPVSDQEQTHSAPVEIPADNPVAVPVLAGEQVLVNGIQAGQIGTVTYSVFDEGYMLDASSARVRVKNGDSISFAGMMTAPEGETISWLRVDIYDATTPEPYTVGAEYYRMDGMRAEQFDLADIPPLTVGTAFGSKEYALVEGGRYIVMFCVGDSDGNGFVDADVDVEDDQGPAVLVEVKLSPENCKHPHSDYVYRLHSSGEIRKQSYGDALTHQIEPLYERYCGLCDIFLMNIWGAGVAEEHALDANGVCMACGYYNEAFAGDGSTDEPVQNGEIAVGSGETLRKLFEHIVQTTNPNRQVNVRTSWENEELAIGDALTLTAELTGYEGLDYTIFWQCDMGSGFEDIPVAEGHQSIQFVVDEQNRGWPWRAGVRIDITIEEAQKGEQIETAENQEAEE